MGFPKNEVGKIEWVSQKMKVGKIEWVSQKNEVGKIGGFPKKMK